MPATMYEGPVGGSSGGGEACAAPDSPPMMTIAMNPTAKCSAVVPRMSPPHSVAIQLKIFTPVGTAINMVVAANTESAIGPRPTANMWWLHTPQLMRPMRTPEYTTTV